MKTTHQEFQEENHKIRNATHRTSLTGIETFLTKLKNTYLNDPEISAKTKRSVKKDYNQSMKLIRAMKKKLK